MMNNELKKEMKIAVTYEDGLVFQHFGHTKCFKVYEIKNGKVQSASILDTNDNGHCALADILKQHGIDALICGGIGAGAKKTLAQAKISLYCGVVGGAEQAITDFIGNKLSFNPDAECDHHHNETEHNCHHNCSNH